MCDRRYHEATEGVAAVLQRLLRDSTIAACVRYFGGCDVEDQALHALKVFRSAQRAQKRRDSKRKGDSNVV